MRALVVRHDHASLPGWIGERLTEHGYVLHEVTVVPSDRHHSPNVDFTFPDIVDYDLLVPLGAPWSVYDRAAIGSWIDGELALLRDAHTLDFPVLAICFGAQALATALGGTVRPAPRPEIGWMTVESHEPGLVPAGPWFQLHFDHFSIPPGALELARSAVGPQAFRIGRSLGVQFHPELTEEILQLWIGMGLAQKPRTLGLDPDELLARTQALREMSRQRARDLVDAFLTQVVEAGTAGWPPTTETRPAC
ncbi:type 1 glutamine amidotransferase [Streptomyces mirabilis]|uniref:type 1 glutamine amidotransferase n=1 Tax=Streptomyces mirabilis TaxID=68239 RepID=UPI0037F6A62A